VEIVIHHERFSYQYVTHYRTPRTSVVCLIHQNVTILNRGLSGASM
jgi:hypothetical protein